MEQEEIAKITERSLGVACDGCLALKDVLRLLSALAQKESALTSAQERIGKLEEGIKWYTPDSMKSYLLNHGYHHDIANELCVLIADLLEGARNRVAWEIKTHGHLVTETALKGKE